MKSRKKIYIYFCFYKKYNEYAKLEAKKKAFNASWLE